MNTENQPEGYRSKNVIEMLTVANEYCLFVEKAEEYPKKEILEYLNKICPLLYIKGTVLPDILLRYPEANERFVTEEQWEKIFSELRLKFEDHDEYWMIDHTDESITRKASLADNFTDIYQDMKDFILLYQRNTVAAQENAVVEIKRLFLTHWGERIVNAMQYLHTVLYDATETKDDFLPEII